MGMLDTQHVHIAKVSQVFSEHLTAIAAHPDLKGHVAVHGQGLMWGVYFPALIDLRDHTLRVGNANAANASQSTTMPHSDVEAQSKAYKEWKVSRAATLASFKAACKVAKV